MERKIGETFEYEGEKLKVVNAGTACDGCYFKGKSCDNRNYDITGICGWTRKDNQPVRFIKVTEEQQDEQPHEETEEVKERKIGEIFEFEDKKLQVKESASSGCDGCFFDEQRIPCSKYVAGYCFKFRADKKKVIFVEVKEETKEQQQKEQPKLNLCEVLRYCPKGEMFWSPVFGDVWFYDIDQYTKRVKVRASGVASWYINADGTITIDKVTSPEIMLYPSRKQRDWSKFTAPWLKKERFDPKTLKAFDRVLVKDEYSEIWSCDLFSHIDNDESYKYFTISTCWNYCIPYNDETKHLVGTTDEAPEFYKYWED